MSAMKNAGCILGFMLSIFHCHCEFAQEAKLTTAKKSTAGLGAVQQRTQMTKKMHWNTGNGEGDEHPKPVEQFQIGLKERRASATSSNQVLDELFALMNRAVEPRKATSGLKQGDKTVHTESDQVFSLQEASRRIQDIAQKEALDPDTQDNSHKSRTELIDAMGDLVKTVQKAYTNAHKLDEEEIKTIQAQFKECNTKLQDTLATVKNEEDTTIKKANETHTLCRSDEYKKYLPKKKKSCKDYEENLKEGSNNDCFCDLFHRSNAEINLSTDKKCLEDALNKRLPKAKGFLDACRNATDEHTQKTKECREDQKEFEEASCSNSRKKNGACKDVNFCHAQVKELKDTSFDAKEKARKNRIHECKAVEKILCFLKVLAEDSNHTEKHLTFQECLTMDFDDKCKFPLNLTVEKKAECVPDTVSPCSDVWVAQEYGGKKWEPDSKEQCKQRPCDLTEEEARVVVDVKYSGKFPGEFPGAFATTFLIKSNHQTYAFTSHPGLNGFQIRVGEPPSGRNVFDNEDVGFTPRENEYIPIAVDLRTNGTHTVTVSWNGNKWFKDFTIEKYFAGVETVEVMAPRPDGGSDGAGWHDHTVAVKMQEGEEYHYEGKGSHSLKLVSITRTK